MPIQFMVGCLMLKRIYNLGDETLPAAWVSNPYMQYFCGEAHFQHQFRCDPSNFVHFRKRIGQPGIEKIFAHSVALHGGWALCRVANSDTTVQENNTTFPTDAKLAKRVIDRCKRIAEAEGIDQRQSYARVSKQLLRDSYNANHPRRAKKATKARRRLRTFAGRVLRELERKLPKAALQRHASWMELASRAITQQRSDKGKVYSLHKPYTCCIAKGKAAKPYEFGNKVGLMTHATKKIILAIEAFEGNPHDSTTIAPLLDQMKRTLQYTPQEVVYDRGGRGKTQINGVTITTPDKPKSTQTESQRRAKRRKFRRRSGMEPEEMDAAGQ
jgi:transposase, IS5 family